MKKIIAIATIAVSVAIFAAVEEFRGVEIKEVGNSVYEISNASFAIPKVATVHYSEYNLSKEQTKELAKEIAKTIYRFTGETNGEIRIVHTETPDIKGPTNCLSAIFAALQAKKVTDEIIRLD